MNVSRISNTSFKGITYIPTGLPYPGYYDEAKVAILNQAKKAGKKNPHVFSIPGNTELERFHYLADGAEGRLLNQLAIVIKKSKKIFPNQQSMNTMLTDLSEHLETAYKQACGKFADPNKFKITRGSILILKK